MASSSSRIYYRGLLWLELVAFAPFGEWREGQRSRQESAEQLDTGFADAQAEYSFWAGIAVGQLLMMVHLLLTLLLLLVAFRPSEDLRDELLGLVMVLDFGLLLGACLAIARSVRPWRARRDASRRAPISTSWWPAIISLGPPVLAAVSLVL